MGQFSLNGLGEGCSEVMNRKHGKEGQRRDC